MNLRRLAGAAAGLLLLTGAAAACSDDESVFNAEAGECIKDVTDLSGNISELPEAECTEDHNGEIIGLFEHDDEDDFPGLDEVNEVATEACQGNIFEDYTGTEYGQSAIIVQPITPTEDSWDEGDRESICVGTTGEDVDVSFKDNGEDFLIGGSDSGDDTDTTEGAGDEEDTSLDDFADLVDSCQGGDFADCDELYSTTPVGSEAEAVGASCGGREDELPDDFVAGFCEETLG